MGATMMQPVSYNRSPEEMFGYPATAIVTAFQNETVEIHFIWYGAAPAALFNNAPNGSFLWDGTNFNLYVKSGTPGAKDGTWKTEALT